MAISSPLKTWAFYGFGFSRSQAATRQVVTKSMTLSSQQREIGLNYYTNKANHSWSVRGSYRRWMHSPRQFQGAVGLEWLRARPVGIEMSWYRGSRAGN